MNVFGVGPGEILLLIIVALILVGPRRLPETAANLGRTVRTIRRYAAHVTAQVREEFADLEAEYEAVREEAKQTSRGLRDVSAEIGEEAAAVGQEIDRSTAEINRSLAQEPIESTATVVDGSEGEERPANVVPMEKRGLPRDPQ